MTAMTASGPWPSCPSHETLDHCLLHCPPIAPVSACLFLLHSQHFGFSIPSFDPPASSLPLGLHFQTPPIFAFITHHHPPWCTCNDCAIVSALSLSYLLVKTFPQCFLEHLTGLHVSFPVCIAHEWVTHFLSLLVFYHCLSPHVFAL